MIEDNPPPSYEEMLEWDEKFTYKVKYSFFKLGNIDVKVYKDTLEGNARWRLETIIKSNSSIPFVGKEENHYNSIFSVTDSLPKEFIYWRDDVDEEEYKNSYYRFDHEKGKIYAREKEIGTDTLSLEKYGGSGHLVFLIARTFAGTKSNLEIPIYVELNQGHLKLYSTQKTEMREYEAFDKPVETYYSEGETDIEGPFGFKGAFKSWYMSDDLRVPLEAHLRVWLGNVKIRLVNYTKRPRE